MLRTQVDVVLPEGAAVLNAEDSAGGRNGRALRRRGDLLQPFDAEAPALVAHRHGGGRAVLLQGGRALLLSDQGEALAANVDSLLQRFRVRRQPCGPEAVLAAVGAAWALGISPELIAAGLDTFVPAP